MLVGSGPYGELSVVVDASGFVHAAFVRNNRIQYLTNRSGSWTRERLTTPAGRDGEPAIALDTDGSVHIAFTRWLPEDPDYCGDASDCVQPPDGIFYITNRSGSWSTPERLTSAPSSSPRLVMRDSDVHLVYLNGLACGELCGTVPVNYRTNATGSWTDEEVGRSQGAPALQLASDGTARIAYWDVSGDGVETLIVRLWLASATTPTGAFQLEEVFRGEGGGCCVYWIYALLLDLDGSDRPHLVANISHGEDQPATYYWTELAGTWNEPTVLSSQPTLFAAAVDDGGAAQLLTSSGGCTVCYLTNRSGTFVEKGLSTTSYWGNLALDTQGRPHVLLTDEQGLWYATRP